MSAHLQLLVLRISLQIAVAYTPPVIATMMAAVLLSFPSCSFLVLVAKVGGTRDVRFRGSQRELEFVLPFGVF